MRLFVAIALPEDVKESIRLMIEGLRGQGRTIRWIPPGNVHLTLKFLGEVAPQIVERVESILQDVVHPHPSFELTVRGSGVFPSPRQPRIVWLGLGTHPVLEEIQRELEEGLGPLGFEPEDREFRPHLTIGRIKSGRRLGAGERDSLMNNLRSLDYGSRSFRVTSIDLMESILKPTGAEYRVRASYPLKG